MLAPVDSGGPAVFYVHQEQGDQKEHGNAVLLAVGADIDDQLGPKSGADCEGGQERVARAEFEKDPGIGQNGAIGQQETEHREEILEAVSRRSGYLRGEGQHHGSCPANAEKIGGALVGELAINQRLLIDALGPVKRFALKVAGGGNVIEAVGTIAAQNGVFQAAERPRRHGESTQQKKCAHGQNRPSLPASTENGFSREVARGQGGAD